MIIQVVKVEQVMKVDLEILEDQVVVMDQEVSQVLNQLIRVVMNQE